MSDVELAWLQKSWELLQFIEPVKNALLMERAIDESTIEKMRGSIEYFNGIVSRRDDWDLSEDLKEDWSEVRGNLERDYGRAMMRTSWTYSDEFQMLQNDQMILQTIRTVETNGYFNPAYSNLMVRLEAIENSQGESDLNDLRWMFSADSESVGQEVLVRLIKAEVDKRVVVTAIALKRYQLKYGKYPADLNALVPEFLSTILLDPVDGKPLRYRPNADGTFILYSIGLNGIDDGGNPGSATIGRAFPWLDSHALDWVWPQPATPAEIQYYYVHPPR